MARTQVTREEWIDAAVAALIEGGVAAVRVDVLAKRIGITRGSFYWYFKDRDALVAAALETWEQRATADIIDGLREIPDPVERLRSLFTQALTADSYSRLEPALAADARHPLVAPVLRRVTERRVAFIADVYEARGYERTTARRQAIVAYAAYTGWLDLRHTASEVLPELAEGGPESAETLAHLAAVLDVGVPDAAG
ncbi:TetR/AcrR family transcriptional regulator [Yinghuangia sp. YIM S09857]|uniref:TetR/AcrR family transcriptional regulator n=1 Tax=Yinghuangia sp. YIM S09857 TaxID=3436929 RepID=UPI003F5370FC